MSKTSRYLLFIQVPYMLAIEGWVLQSESKHATCTPFPEGDQPHILYPTFRAFQYPEPRAFVVKPFCEMYLATFVRLNAGPSFTNVRCYISHAALLSLGRNRIPVWELRGLDCAGGAQEWALHMVCVRASETTFSRLCCRSVWNVLNKCSLSDWLKPSVQSRRSRVTNPDKGEGLEPRWPSGLRRWFAIATHRGTGFESRLCQGLSMA